MTVLAPSRLRSASSGLGRWLQRAAPGRAAGDVTIALVSDATMRRLNRKFRGKQAVTDVLSFPAGDETFPPVSPSPRPKALGDIVIAGGRARLQAKAAGHPLATELRVLALHGLLHLLGYDHERDEGEMARIERTLRRRHGLEAGLIERHRWR